ncbi:MAG: aldose 1-epimerase family protein [Christensenella sp.]|nr:aldose 1-epimerase family protein [Christensenella sp.]
MEIFELSCGSAAAKVQSLGGELCSYVPANGREYVWQGNPDVWGSHAPILFPCVGSTVDGVVKIGGTEYPQKKHGSIRKRQWKVAKHGEDFIEMVMEADEDTRKEYPFDFTAHIVHTIREDGFTTTFLIENRSAQVMPMCIGGHPGFNCPVYDGEKFTDYVLEFEQVEDGKNLLCPDGYIITGSEYIDGFRNTNILHLDHALFDDRDALMFDGLRSHKVKLINEKTGKGLLFSFPKFHALGVWSAPGKNADYVCLEPWCGLPAIEGESGNMEDKPYVRMLEPGRSFKVEYSMTVID